MAAFKRYDRPNEAYRIWPTLPEPWGRVGPWQTGLRSKREADRVEAWVKEMAFLRPNLIDALVEGRVSLRDAWIAKMRGADHLDELIAGHGDPVLKDAIKAYLPHCTDKRALTGLDQLELLAPAGVRLSWLRESAAIRGQKPLRNISALYRRAIEEGRKASSVRRSLHRAVRELLVYEFDEEGARQRLAGLSGRIPREDDERKVRVSPDELRQLMAATDVDRFRWMILTAILTTADRGPLLKTIPRHFDDDAGTLEIYDRKTKHRHRLVALGSSARTILRLATGGLEDDERVFPWTVWQVRNMWEAARDRAAGRPSRMQRRWGQKLPDPIGDEAAAFFEQEGVVTLQS